MNVIRETFFKLEEMMSKGELIENLQQRILIMEQKINQLNDVDENKWVSLKEASIKLCKSPAAIRQKLKNPKSLMAKNIVWKQKYQGAEILINLKKYRKCL